MINGKLTDKLVDQLPTFVSECLGDEKGIKRVRNYYYFPNIWHCPYQLLNQDCLLFNKLSEIIDCSLMNQTQFTCDSVNPN